tara:strand:- start:178 stop:540 length:363 start_codon:yes stop_codon:yes gene_type:complete
MSFLKRLDKGWYVFAILLLLIVGRFAYKSSVDLPPSDLTPEQRKAMEERMSKGTVTIFNSSRSHLMGKESRENNASDTPDLNGSTPIQSPKEAAKKRALGLYISGEINEREFREKMERLK